MASISKETPLAELTLRKYERPAELPKRELIRKLCLSLGLLQPGDSRDIIVDIFYVLLESSSSLTSEEIQNAVLELRKRENLPLKGVAQSNIRRQLRRLRELFFVEKTGNSYRISENESLLRIFEEKIEKFYLPSIVERIKEYIKALDSNSKRFINSKSSNS